MMLKGYEAKKQTLSQCLLDDGVESKELPG
jgi:hypothetical protein